MTEYTISLPEKIYRLLIAAAQKKGLNPVDWIALQLPQPPAEPEPLPSLLTELIGVLDSKA
ncbi:MAG: hypothetical protein QNJ46_19005 [Leptolyngbyaceae cyanobacterium MO_188.B28]|nr:hypothetical protein [Leptolyngbyaceae cyanobacterium MO_188.B28]